MPDLPNMGKQLLSHPHDSFPMNQTGPYSCSFPPHVTTTQHQRPHLLSSQFLSDFDFFHKCSSFCDNIARQGRRCHILYPIPLSYQFKLMCRFTAAASSWVIFIFISYFRPGSYDLN
ncbi:unnamed protein product [Prunus armeniaca]|uniref:Uncharacterized protein n=1 Tax=Prunus armeniaca TaxID=36596 RepID=A0A6J5VCS8_PRUAR|nr:unnamed protein product [Prunus armeniaca]